MPSHHSVCDVWYICAVIEVDHRWAVSSVISAGIASVSKSPQLSRLSAGPSLQLERTRLQMYVSSLPKLCWLHNTLLDNCILCISVDQVTVVIAIVMKLWCQRVSGCGQDNWDRVGKVCNLGAASLLPTSYGVPGECFSSGLIVLLYFRCSRSLRLLLHLRVHFECE